MDRAALRTTPPATPPHQPRRPGGRRPRAAARRDQPGAPGRAVPGRIARVLAAGAGGGGAAAGGTAGGPRPGEISLAPGGLLFLDELPEFSPRALEVMRQPLEDRLVTISRAQGTLTFPPNFQLIAAMNPS